MRTGHEPGQATDAGGGLVGAQNLPPEHLYILLYISTANRTTLQLILTPYRCTTL